MNEFTELEFKYKANDIGLLDFQKLMETIGYKKSLDVSSWDYYYTDEHNNFIRFRESNTPELTIKRKTVDSNNWNRVEVDLPLDCDRISKTTVENFVRLQNYKLNFKVYKTCHIYWQEFVNYVYYIVYDEQMRERDRFIEVEHNKSSIDFCTPTSTPHTRIKQAEELLTWLSISPQNRMKKSLFELYRR